MAACQPQASLPFETRFGLQWQVRLLLVASIGLTLSITYLAQRSQWQLSACVKQVGAITSQSALANQIAQQVLLCRQLEARFGLVWDLPALRQQELAKWKSAQQRLAGLLEQLQATPLAELEQRQVTAWRQAVRHHGASFLKLAEDLDAGRLARHQDLLDNLDRKERHLCGLLQSVEKFTGGKMAAIQAQGREIRDIQTGIQWGVTGRAILSVLIVCGAGWWFSHHVIERIRRLTVTVARFGEGELQIRMPVAVHDELGILGYQFNEMAAEIQVSLNRLNREIAQHKQTAAELTKAQEAAQSASLAKNEFLANVSHEIRTPMTAILGFTDVLLGNVEQPEAVEAARTIERNGAFLLEIIDDILDLSKIEAGKLKLEHRPCSPQQILNDVVELMRVRADAKGLCLEVAHEGPLPATIYTDPTRLRQILINLLGNAIKFTETGSVRVAVRLVDQTGAEPKLRFDVTDTGIGIRDDRLVHLFTPFTQGDSSMHRQYGGSGLGLAISKRLAEMLGGTITVSSQPGKGSTFTATVRTGPLDDQLWLPAAWDSEDLPSSEATVSEQPIQLNCRVLLAEDGPDNQRLLSFLLKKAGAEVTVAENGRIAVEKALSWRKHHGDPAERFDMILMDMQMPVMDGYEATRRLRREGHWGPIVALTAHAMTDDRQKCLNAGCDDYVTKPVDRQHLLTVLASVLTRAREVDRCGKNQWPGELTGIPAGREA